MVGVLEIKAIHSAVMQEHSMLAQVQAVETTAHRVHTGKPLALVGQDLEVRCLRG